MTARITPQTRTLDVSAQGYPYPRIVDAAAVVGTEIIEVEVITVTVHRVTARALAEINANHADGSRGTTALGELLVEHARATDARVAVESVTVSGGDQADLIVGGWEYAATTAADRVVPVPQTGGIRVWLDAYRGAWAAARDAAGFADLVAPEAFTATAGAL